jgi:small subunit ribosomal protein S17
MADEEQNEQQPEETAEETPAPPESAVEAEASAEMPPEPDPEAPPEEPGPPVPEPESPEPMPEPAPPAEPVAEGEEAPVAEDEDAAPVAAEGEEAPVEEQPAPVVAPAKKKRKRIPRSERRKRSKPTPESPAERRPITRLPKPEGERGRRQERRGVVVSAAMDKTIVVRVETVKSHRRYKKVVRRSQKFHAHDEQNQAKAGDIVRIVETRPLSKTKNWRLAEVVEAAR